MSDEPSAARSGAELVKRVIALPGDAVQIRGGAPAQYEVLLRPGNTGSWLRVVAPAWRGQWQSRTTCCAANGAKTPNLTTRVIPAGSYFVMGDNPDVSIDTRSFGWIRGSAINGRLGVRIWPLSAGRAIGNRPQLVPSG